MGRMGIIGILTEIHMPIMMVRSRVLWLLLGSCLVVSSIEDGFMVVKVDDVRPSGILFGMFIRELDGYDRCVKQTMLFLCSITSSQYGLWCCIGVYYLNHMSRILRLTGINISDVEIQRK